MIALDDVADELQALAEHVRAKHASPALAWGVMIDGRLAMGGGAGVLDDGRAPTATTSFRIASMTKSFTAATVLALRDEGVAGEPRRRAVPGRTPPTSDSPAITSATPAVDERRLRRGRPVGRPAPGHRR